MCGILCTVCASTNEAQCRRKKIVENTRPFLLRRGPDHFGEKEFECSWCSAVTNKNTFGEKHQTTSISIHFATVVLHLRGKCVAKQPVEDNCGNILAWNGEIFAGLDVLAHESDTAVLLRKLHTPKNDTVEHILRVMSRVHGPWAFVYYQANQETLWFGRDYFGRRSLLWHFPSSPTDLFSLASVGTRFREDSREQFWKEVPANGIYSLDLKKLYAYLFTGEESTVDFQTILQSHPWQDFSSGKNPICPVRNPFNRQLPDDGISSTLSESGITDDASETSAVGSSNNCVDAEKDVTEFLLDMATGVASKIEIKDTTSISIVEPSVNTFRRNTSENNASIPTKTSNQCGRKVKDLDGSSTKEDLPTIKYAEKLVDVGQSSKRSPNFNDENDCARAPVDLSAVKRDIDEDFHIAFKSYHIDKNVVVQFTSVLLEAVRKRVFNLPRGTEGTASSLLSSKVQRTYSKVDEREEDNCPDRTFSSNANVGILFSGGLDSIVLAALADRCIPREEPIDLINVAFEQKSANTGGSNMQGRKRNNKHYQSSHNEEPRGTNFEVPDRITGRNGVAELRDINPQRKWNFVEVNITLEELQKERSKYITHLVSPQSSVLDDSIGCALWFAARGKGNLTCSQCLDNVREQHNSCDHLSPYICPAKVLLVGMGADEQLGGYARHRSRFKKEGWEGLVNEIEMEVARISERNLGRDDRYEWCEKEYVDTTELHIPPCTAREHGTPVFKADERAPEWELSE